MYGSDEVIGDICFMKKLVVISNCMIVAKNKTKHIFFWSTIIMREREKEKEREEGERGGGEGREGTLTLWSWSPSPKDEPVP